MIKLRYPLMAMLLAFGSLAVASQDPAQSHAEHHPEAQAAPPATPTQGREVMEKCRQMMAQQDETMKRMQARMNTSSEAGDKKLEALLAEVNKASGNDKIEALTKVVAEIAAQRKAMQVQMMQMHQEMMSNMMERMQNSAACPMIQGMTQGANPSSNPQPQK
jgi:hypothetical protein